MTLSNSAIFWLSFGLGVLAGGCGAFVAMAVWLWPTLRHVRRGLLGGAGPKGTAWPWLGWGELRSLFTQCAQNIDQQMIAQLQPQPQRCPPVCCNRQPHLETVLAAAQVVIWEYDFATAQVQAVGQRQDEHPLADWPEFEAVAAQARAGQDTFHVEYCVADTSEAAEAGWKVMQGRVFRDETGQPQVLVGVTFDITESKQLGLALQASQAQLADVLDNAFGSLVQLRLYEDNSWAYEFWSAGAESVFGYRAEEFLGHQELWRSRIPLADQPAVLQAAEDLRQQGRAYKEYRFQAPDGTLRWIASWGRARWDDYRHCWLVTITDIDISDRKRLETDLLHSKAQLKQILDNIQACVAQFRRHRDQSLQYELWSAGSELVFGYRPDELMADPDLWFSRIPPQDYDDKILPAIQRQNLGQTVRKVYRFRHKDGSLRWIASHCASRWDETQDCWLVTAVDQDISEQKYLELALQDSQNRLSDILDNTLACIVQYRWKPETQEWIYEFWSAGAELVFGFTSAEFMADQNLWFSRILPEDVATQILPTWELIVQGQSYYKEYRFRHKDGSLRWIASAATSRWSADDGCWIVTVVDTDISDRKTLAAALEASQQQLSDILDTVRTAICTFRVRADYSWNYDYFSCGCQEVFGFTPAALQADHQLWLTRLHPEDVESVTVTQMETILAGQGAEFEYRFLHGDGRWRWLNTTQTVRKAPDQDGWLVTAVTFDVTQRKSLELALRDSEKRLANILDNANVAVASLRLKSAQHWSYDYCSAGYQRVFGFTPAEFKAAPHLWRSRLDPDKCQAWMDALLADLLVGREHRVELRFQHKNGDWRWIAQYYTSRWDAAEACWNVISVSQDITDRRAAEEDLRRYERVVAATQDGVALVDRNYTYQIANATYLQRLGKSQSEVIGHTIPELLGNETFQRIQPWLERCLVGELVQFEFWYDYPAAGRRFIGATYSPCRSMDGTVWGIVGSFHDLTDLKLVEEALRNSERRFRTLAANLPGILYQYVRFADGTEGFPYISPGIWDLYGLEADSIMADPEPMWQAVHPEDIASLQASIEGSAQTLMPWQWEGRIVHTSGQIKWVRGVAKLETHPDGKLVWDGLLIDISDRKQAEALLYAERNLLTEVMNTSVAAVVVLDPQGQIIYANDHAEQVLGLSRDQITQRTYDDPSWRPTAVDGGPWPLDAQPFSQVMATGGPVYNIRHAIEWPDGRRRILSVNGAPVYNQRGDITKLVFTINDITDQLVAEMSLRRSEERYRLVAENMSDLVCLHRPDGTYLYVTPSCRSLLGYAPEELIDRNPRSFLHPQDCDRIFPVGRPPAITDSSDPITYRMRHKDGHYVWLETLSKPIVDDQQRVIQLQTTSRDVSEKVEIQSQLEHDAIHDGLTGLPNRSLLMERLELAIERLNRHSAAGFAVLFLDLDRFKVINDSLGHNLGDELLVAMANLLSAQLRSIDLAARLGGDEFVVLLEDITDGHEAVQVAQRILAALKQPFKLSNREVFVSTSIGIALGATHYDNGGDILRDADIAMYQAKSEGKSRYTIFDPAMHLRVLKEMHLENALRRAVENEEFCLYYQPIVRLQDGQIMGFEALVRWPMPGQGLVSPADFIPLAEETGLIVDLGLWILHQACQELSGWQQHFPAAQGLTVNVNLSARQLKDARFSDALGHILQATRLSPQCLNLEVTESILIEDVELILANLNAIRAQGIRLSIDDFGTGYSSLSYLHRFPFTCIKVDRTFVNQLITNPESTGIVTSILALADSLDLNVVAEGVETAQQIHYLRQLGCELAQGYYFSRPLPSEQVTVLLRQDSPRFEMAAEVRVD